MDQRHSLKSTPFVLVTGFLGSGKTTLLKRFLFCSADKQKIAIIQNEFANANVDGQALKETGKTFKMVEINQGSVFCVCLLASFVQSLVSLLDSCQPDIIILEATGLADPIAIGQLLGARELKNRLHLAHVWCVIDSTSFLKLEPQVQRLSHQVRIADTVILNKSDRVSQANMDMVEKRTIELNPYAHRVRASFCDGAVVNLIQTFSQRPDPQKKQQAQETLETCGPPAISSAVLRTTIPISRAGLENFLRVFEKTAYRIKGYVNLMDQTVVSTQSCFGQTCIQTIQKEPGPTELIALGPQIDQQDFASQFQMMANLY
jgi:G3E family GTPase